MAQRGACVAHQATREAHAAARTIVFPPEVRIALFPARMVVDLPVCSGLEATVCDAGSAKATFVASLDEAKKEVDSKILEAHTRPLSHVAEMSPVSHCC